MYPFKAPRKAFTLVEVLIVAFIALFSSLAILGGLYFVNRAQKYARERTHAQQIAASMIEVARQTPFKDLVTNKNQSVLIDDNGTPTDSTDDLVGSKSLTLYLPPGGTANEVANTIGEEYVIVEASVTWFSGGSSRAAGTERRVSIVTQFAP